MAPTADPSVAALDVLVGEWMAEGIHPLAPQPIRVTTTFEWMEGGRFLIQRTAAPPPFPSALSLIGREDPDDAGSPLVMHYFDSRGVARRYAVTLADGVWTLTRDGDGFSQRYSGTFSDDGATITGAWEISDGPGQPLHHDFGLNYRRAT